jgi:hypothetical protein
LKLCEDHLNFEILQIFTKLTTTTTILLLLIFQHIPPKRFEKFKKNLHAAISSSTWQATFQNCDTSHYPLVFGLNHFNLVMMLLMYLLCIKPYPFSLIKVKE